MLCSELPPRIHQSLEVLVCLARDSGPLQTQQISAKTKLLPAQTAKILQSLTWTGFVDSRRGIHGGFWLSRPAHRVHVAKVIAFFARRQGAYPVTGPGPLIRVLM